MGSTGLSSPMSAASPWTKPCGPMATLPGDDEGLRVMGALPLEAMTEWMWETGSPASLPSDMRRTMELSVLTPRPLCVEGRLSVPYVGGDVRPRCE